MKRSVESTVCFFKDMLKTLRAIPPEDAGVLMTALFAHANGEDPEGLEASPVAAALYTVFENQVDRLDGYRHDMAARGKTGGEKSKREANEKQTEAETKQTEPPIPIPFPYPEKERSLTGSKEKRFAPPTAREVESYAEEKGLDIDAQRFVDFYTSKGWKVGSSPMKDWKAAARNWAARDKTEMKPVKKPDFNFDQRHTDYEALMNSIGW